MSQSSLESVVNHVALPPQLPGICEDNTEQLERDLTGRVLDATRTLRDLTNGELSQQWESIRNTVQLCKTVNAGGKLNKTSLLTEFRRLAHKAPLILHIAEQNAGLLIHRHHNGQNETVIFEAFEASPLSEKVLEAENALQWNFPGRAVAIPYLVFDKAPFQDSLATFLEQASTESIKCFAARTTKAGSNAYESRDTVDPALITQMLMTLLEVNGHRIFPRLLRKCVRDDVCWTDGADKPWRRSAYWLVLRVGLERHMCAIFGGDEGKAHYKFLLCLVLARLLDDTLDFLSLDVLAFLRAKLTRRLVKLDVEKDRALQKVRPVYELMFAALGPAFHKTTNKANAKIEGTWNDFMKTFRKPIRLLPRRANQEHLVLRLPNSGPYLQGVLSWSLRMNSGLQSFASNRLLEDFDVTGATTNSFKTFANRCFLLSEFETDIKDSFLSAPTSAIKNEENCVKYAREIDTYLDAVANFYDSNPEQKSIMLLTVMQLWMSMDHPGIPTDALDVLHLPYFVDMLRLQEIEQYLRERHVQCGFSRKTIFDDLVDGCFAERYFNESKDSQRLQDLRQAIETAAEFARQRKENEWQELSEVFEELGRSIAESSCVYKSDGGRTIHDDRKCTKCYLRRRARRVTIHIHEHPLPSNDIQAKAVVFDVGCPKAFTAYRNATWSCWRPWGVQSNWIALTLG